MCDENLISCTGDVFVMADNSIYSPKRAKRKQKKVVTWEKRKFVQSMYKFPFFYKYSILSSLALRCVCVIGVIPWAQPWNERACVFHLLYALCLCVFLYIFHIFFLFFRIRITKIHPGNQCAPLFKKKGTRSCVSKRGREKKEEDGAGLEAAAAPASLSSKRKRKEDGISVQGSLKGSVVPRDFSYQHLLLKVLIPFWSVFCFVALMAEAATLLDAAPLHHSTDWGKSYARRKKEIGVCV